MAGYLDQYGAGDERRIKVIKTLVFSVIAVLVLGGVGFFLFHNYKQEREVKRFFELLQAHDYQGAYGLWVRTDSDRRGYPFPSFMQDWGPSSGHADVSGFQITKSRSCGNGVILTVDFAKGQQEKLWVPRDNPQIGFSPLPGCPAPR
jgi:hypothetical protein